MLYRYSMFSGLTLEQLNALRLVRPLCSVTFGLRRIVILPVTNTCKMYLLHL